MFYCSAILAMHINCSAWKNLTNNDFMQIQPVPHNTVGPDSKTENFGN